MANTVVVMDGFENFPATTLFAAATGSVANYGSGTGHEAGTALRLGGSLNTWQFVKLLPAATLNTTWFTASFMYKRLSTALGGTTSQAQMGVGSSISSSSASTCRMALILPVDGSVMVRKDATTYGTSATGIINPDVWYHIEYRHRYGNATNGNFEVRVNGLSVLTGVGDNSGVANPIYAGFSGGGESQTATKGLLFDDLILAQSTDASPGWFGISKVRHLAPTSTSTGQWAGSDGDSVNNHLLVDDIDAASTDWVTSTAGSVQRDLYGHGAASTGATVHAIQARVAAGVDATGVDDFSVVVKSGATENLLRKTLGAGTPIWLEAGVLNTDPATGAAWTKTGFDASLFGVKS